MYYRNPHHCEDEYSLTSFNFTASFKYKAIQTLVVVDIYSFNIGVKYDAIVKKESAAGIQEEIIKAFSKRINRASCTVRLKNC